MTSVVRGCNPWRYAGGMISQLAAHVGQIVLLAKHFAGTRWQTLSIPRRQSA